MMKKILALVLIALLLGACGQKGSDDRLASIKENGKLTVAFSPDYPPYEFIHPDKTGDERYVGSDVELARYIAQELGVELQLVAMDFGLIPDAIARGLYDLGISGFTFTEERAELITFSKPYDSTEAECQGLLVPKSKENDFKSLDDFAGKKIAAQNGSIQKTYAESQINGANIQLITKINDGILMLQNGQVDALAISCSSASSVLANISDLVLSDVYFEVMNEIGTMAIMQQGQESLEQAINEIIEDVVKQGLYLKWMDEARALAKELGMDNAE